MIKNEKKNLADLKLSFELNEWEDFLLVLNEIRDRDRDLVSMYRNKYLALKNK